eukprot:500482_1
MSDQVTKLRNKGISAVFWNSTLKKYERQQIEYDIRIGKIDMIYTTPESLLSRTNGIKNLLIKNRTVTTFCIDETHCIIMWGSSFRPSYFALAESLKDFKNPTVIACTATVPHVMKEDIINNLKIKHNVKEYLLPSNRPNIELNIEFLSNQKHVFYRAVQLIGMIHQKYDLNKNSMIIFGGMIKTATEFYEYLKNESSLDIIPGLYHSKIKKNERNGVLNDFLNGSKNVIVATSGFGMGIDKSNVRCVIHLAMAPNPEEWQQQIGRAGRDGLQSHAYLLTHTEDKFASYCVNKSCKVNVQKTKAFLFEMYNVQEKRIGTLGQIYRKMNGIPESDAMSSLDMSMEEMFEYVKYGNSMKILQRYGIIHQAGNSVYLLRKDGNDIDWKEVDEIDAKNMSSFRKMTDMVRPEECIRKCLLRYFGEEYVKPKK